MTHTLTSRERAVEIARNLRSSGLTIYDAISVGDPKYWLPAPELEYLLDPGLRGLCLAYPPRTRSKVLKERVCEILGYPVPKSFTKTQPGFRGQDFDTYVQKALNLQVWNEDLSPTRRYVIVGVDSNSQVHRVRVVSGDTLAALDRTGTVTQKYQARFSPGNTAAEVVGLGDSDLICRVLPQTLFPEEIGGSPTDAPTPAALLPIAELLRRLKPLLGLRIPALGAGQERNRGAGLHREVCRALGYSHFADRGDLPDIRHQLLEVKLQTTPTIDLGLVTPDSATPLDVPYLDGLQVRHCDIRYAVFYGEVTEDFVTITHLVLTPGERFYLRFEAFGGKVLNTKRQIRLPPSFFLR